MTAISPSVVGIASVSPFGPVAGLIPQASLQPAAVPWATSELPRAFTVTPFRPASVVPGLKTRRLDRLSSWALVAASLALQDAGIDLGTVDRSRVAVVFATGFGCVELTESFYQSAAVNGWSGTDPITFPETLTNAPAGHVALFHGLRGPNITVDSKSFAGESALIQAASLIRHGQADLAIVLAGDALTQTLYGWYQAAGMLSPACFNTESFPLIGSGACAGFVPSEGVAALVLSAPGISNSQTYAHFRSGRWAAGGDPLTATRDMLSGVSPDLAICAGNGAPCATSPLVRLAREIVGPDKPILPRNPVAGGLAESGALLHLVLALSTRPPSGQALMLTTAGKNGFAAIHLEIP